MLSMVFKGLTIYTNHTTPPLPFYSSFNVTTLTVTEYPQILARLGHQATHVFNGCPSIGITLIAWWESPPGVHIVLLASLLMLVLLLVSLLLASLYAVAGFTVFVSIPALIAPNYVSSPVIAYIPAVACFPAVVSCHDIAVILNVACCWHYCCCLCHCCCFHPDCGRHWCCCWCPLSS